MGIPPILRARRIEAMDHADERDGPCKVNPRMTTNKLRVCVFLDGETGPLWIAELLRAIDSCGAAEIVLAVMPEASSQPRPSRLRRWLRSGFRPLLRAAAAKFLTLWHARLFERSQSVRDALVETSLTGILDTAARIYITPRRTLYSDYFEQPDLDRLAAYDIDVVVRLGYRILRGDVLRVPRYGVWSFHHGDNRINRGGPPGFWEVMLGWAETGATLQILSEDLDAGTVLARTRSSTIPFSVHDNTSAIHWAALAMVPRQLLQLRTLGGDAFLERVARDNQDPTIYHSPLYRHPDNLPYARLLLRKSIEKARQLLVNRFWRNQWILLFHFGADPSLSLRKFRRLLPPPDRFWADPFVLEREGRHYIFIEELVYAENRGHIAVIEMDHEGRASQPAIVLQKPYHLSYPFLFEFGGDLYMVPETAANRTIELYRCTQFPHQWEHVHDLMQGVSAYDTTLLHRDGRWWMFTTLVEVDGAPSWNELFVFSAPSPLSLDWTPHPLNPVVSDCRSARPAGPLFEHHGALYRPSQNSSGRYGYGFNFCRVDMLSDTDYREQIVARALPDWAPDVIATHSYSRSGDLHVIDAQVRRRRI